MRKGRRRDPEGEGRRGEESEPTCPLSYNGARGAWNPNAHSIACRRRALYPFTYEIRQVDMAKISAATSEAASYVSSISTISCAVAALLGAAPEPSPATMGSSKPLAIPVRERHLTSVIAAKLWERGST